MAEQIVDLPGAVITPTEAKPVSLAQIAGPRSTARPVSQAPRGDELIAKAQQEEGLDPEEQTFIKLFTQSNQIIKDRIAADEGYATTFVEEFKKKKGDDAVQFIIDKADEIRIDHKKRNDPTFTPQNALSQRFLDSVTFGQSSRLVGAAAELSGEADSDAVVETMAEELRLLQKAYPKSDLLGEVGSYLAPLSPVAKVFGLGNKAASLAKSGNALKVFGKVQRNPKLLQKIGATGLNVGTGAGAIGGIRGFLGEGQEEAFQLDRAVEEGGLAFFTGFVAGGGLSSAAAGTRAVANKAAPIVKSTSKRFDRSLGQLFEGTTGVREEALRQQAADVAATKAGTIRLDSAGVPLTIRGQANKQADIGDDLSDFLLSAKYSKLPEVQQADALLEKLPSASLKNTLKYMRSSIEKANPSQQGQAGIIDEWIKYIETSVPKKELPTRIKGRIVEAADDVPAKHVQEKVVEQMQEAVRNQYGKDSPYAASVLKTAARIARLDLRKASAGAGETGQLYRSLMDKAAEKRGLLKFVEKRLGSTDEKIAEKAEGFVRNLYGVNKTVIQDKMRLLDQKFGTDFSERARLASMGKSFGSSGQPEILPNFHTGGFAKGTAAGAAVLGGAGLVAGEGRGGVGTGLGAMGGLALSSPRVAVKMLGSSSKMSGFARRLFASPKALDRIGVDRAFDPTIRKLARIVQKAHLKDGPVTASGYVRLIADTPYFIGFVEAFDRVEQELEKNKNTSTIQKFRIEQRKRNEQGEQ